MELATAIDCLHFGDDRVSGPKTTAVAQAVDPTESAEKAKKLVLYEFFSGGDSNDLAHITKANRMMETVEVEGMLARQPAGCWKIGLAAFCTSIQFKIAFRMKTM
jgi:hypothetical protein